MLCHVGYALNPKKMRKSSSSGLSNQKSWTGGGLADILTDEIEDEVQFSAFDFERPLYQQLTEDIRSGDEDSRSKIKMIEDYCRLHPKTVIVDPIDAVEKVTSRARVCQVIETICQQTTLFSQPKFVIAHDNEKIVDRVLSSNLRFPVICKPIEACGTANSHSLIVAINAEGLKLVHCPCIIQEYMDHGESFYKVYVIDNEVKVYLRPSLPDLCEMMLPGSRCAHANESEKHLKNYDNNSFTQLRSLAFDSRLCYPTIEDFVVTTTNTNTPTTDSDTETSTYSADSSLALVHTAITNATVSSPPPSSNPYHSPRKEVIDMLATNAVSIPVVVSACDPMTSTKTALGLASPPTPTPNYALTNRVGKKRSLSGSASADTVTQARFEAIAKELAAGFNLSLFGFDVIIPTKQDKSHDGNHKKKNVDSIDITKAIIKSTNDEELLQESLFGRSRCANNEYVVIDVNFFPSYKEVTDFPSRLRSFLRSKSGLL